MKALSLESSALHNVTLEGERVTFGKGWGHIKIAHTCEPGKFIVLDITGESERSSSITWRFEAADGRSISFRMGLLPRLKTRIALPYSILDGSVLFLPRTPGKLKTVTNGRPLPIEDVVSFSIVGGNPIYEEVFTIHALYIADSEPDYPLDDVKMVDELGQKMISEWEGKTHGEAELKRYLNEELDKPASQLPGRSRFGGFEAKKFKASGYFRLDKDERRYWLVDPEGNAFWSMGLDCVQIDGDCNLTGITKLCKQLPPRGSVGWQGEREFFSFHRSNLYKGFGEDWYKNWCTLTRKRLDAWGFNTIACWSDLRFASRAKLPYTYIMHGRPKTEKQLFRDFPDVFSPEYSSACAEWAKQIAPFAEDEYLLGYFMGNEPEWAFVNDLNLAAMLLESGRELESCRTLLAWLAEKYGDISTLNTAWGTDYTDFESITKVTSEVGVAVLWDFTAEMIREYMRVQSEAIRVYDKNHLNLGIRYAWLSSKVLASGSEYVDIFSFNCYKMDPTESIDGFYEKVGKPVIIGEFHFGALDVGLDATGLRGVESQYERGAAYRHYMQKAAAHPMCLGAHYFTLNDQAYLGRFDGENYQIGVIDCCQKPYADFLSGILETHAELYEIADGKKPAEARAAKEIPAIAF